jgi:lysophospholipase L1-like esterase
MVNKNYNQNKQVMRTLLFISATFVMSLSCLSTVTAQKKIVVMGSSTAAGAGADPYFNSWAGRLADYFKRNTSDGLDTVIYNIALSGYTTYHEMPTGFVPPSGRPLPDANHNVTKALSYIPDVVIINLPSNDMAALFTKQEMMDNLRAINSIIKASGARCFITTTQPRNDLSDTRRQFQKDLVDSINNNFGLFAIDFWSDLVTNDGQNRLKDEVRDPGSDYHINNLGHNFVFIKTRAKQLFPANSVLPVKITSFLAQAVNNKVVLKWKTEEQEPNTIFEVQRSTDARNFETIATQHIVNAQSQLDYTETDFYPLPGNSYYRLKINESGKTIYSFVVSITTKGKNLSIHQLSSNTSSSSILATINSINNQTVMMSILTATGAVVWQQSFYITKPTAAISIPVNYLAAGQYYLKVQGADQTVDIKAFVK